MTKNDYELFANEINQVKCEQTNDKKRVVRILVDTCKRVFAKNNPLFQADKFERACYEGKHIRKSISGKV